MATKRTPREVAHDDHYLDVIERLTRLESEHLQLHKVMEGTDDQPGLVSTLRDVNTRLTKYETRWGMIVMLITAVAAALTMFKDWILERIRS
jgi:hypothetical protein